MSRASNTTSRRERLGCRPRSRADVPALCRSQNEARSTYIVVARFDRTVKVLGEIRSHRRECVGRGGGRLGSLSRDGICCDDLPAVDLCARCGSQSSVDMFARSGGVQTLHDFELLSASAIDGSGSWRDRDETRPRYRLLNSATFFVRRRNSCSACSAIYRSLEVPRRQLSRARY